MKENGIIVNPTDLEKIIILMEGTIKELLLKEFLTGMVVS